MKKILILGIVGIITLSIIGCNNNSMADNQKANFESTSVENRDNKAVTTGDVDINIKINEKIDEKIPLGNINNINIEISAENISIKAYDGEEIKITGKLSEKSRDISINKKDDKFEMIETGYDLIQTFMNNENDKSIIDVLIPSKFKGEFALKQGGGLAEVEGIKVKYINISGGVGKLECNNINFDRLNLNSGVGKIDLNLNEKCGDIEINGDVGETNIKMKEVGGNLKYRGSVGSINIKIPENSPVKFDVEKGVGSYNINAKTSGEQTYIFDLKSGVGTINITN